MFESSDKQRVADILLQCLLILFIRMDCSTDTKSKRKDLVVFACICDETALLFICRMDGNNCFKLEIRIVAPNCRGSWYSLDKFVDADFTNFKDLVDEVVDKIYYFSLNLIFLNNMKTTLHTEGHTGAIKIF